MSDTEKTTNFIKFKNSGAVLAYTNQYGIVFHNTHGIFITPDEWDTLSQPQSFSYSYNHIFDNLTNEDIYEAFTELVLKEFPFDPPHNIFHSKTAELLNIPSTFMSQMGLSFYLELTIERIAKLSGIPDKELYILFGLDKSAGPPSEQAQRAFYLQYYVGMSASIALGLLFSIEWLQWFILTMMLKRRKYPFLLYVGKTKYHYSLISFNFGIRYPIFIRRL